MEVTGLNLLSPVPPPILGDWAGEVPLQKTYGSPPVLNFYCMLELVIYSYSAEKRWVISWYPPPLPHTFV